MTACRDSRFALRPRLCRRLIQLALLGASGACAYQAPAEVLPPVSVSGQSSSPVEKSYRKMVQGMDHFERQRAVVAPDAALRFKLLPRKQGTDIDRIVLKIMGNTFDRDVPIAPDHTFVLQPDPQAWKEDAVVSPNRKRLSMTWRTDIRTPGIAGNSRRLGDLRLECEVGMEAGLVSNNSVIGRIAALFTTTKAYCDRKDARYMFFADRPLFSVTLVAGNRREVLPVDQLYAGASDDPALKDDLPFCDCEMLVDRTYFLPLGDHSWPDDTRVEFEYMDVRP